MSTEEFRKLINDVHWAGYHDALTNVEPNESQRITVEAALVRAKRNLSYETSAAGRYICPTCGGRANAERSNMTNIYRQGDVITPMPTMLR